MGFIRWITASTCVKINYYLSQRLRNTKFRPLHSQKRVTTYYPLVLQFPFCYPSLTSSYRSEFVCSTRLSIINSFPLRFKAQYLLFFSQLPHYATRPTLQPGWKILSATTAWKMPSHADCGKFKRYFMKTFTMCGLPHSWETVVLKIPKLVNDNYDDLVFITLTVIHDDMKSVAYMCTFKNSEEVPDNVGDIFTTDFYRWCSRAMFLQPSDTQDVIPAIISVT